MENTKKIMSKKLMIYAAIFAAIIIVIVVSQYIISSTSLLSPPQRKQQVPFLRDMVLVRDCGKIRVKVSDGKWIYADLRFVEAGAKVSPNKTLADVVYEAARSGASQSEIDKQVAEKLAATKPAIPQHKVWAGPFTAAQFDRVMTTLRSSPLFRFRVGAKMAQSDGIIYTADPGFLVSIGYHRIGVGKRPNGRYMSRSVRAVLKKYASSKH